MSGYRYPRSFRPQSSCNLRVPGYPNCVLLDSYAHIVLADPPRTFTESAYWFVSGDVNNNTTTAQAYTKATGNIKVTFFIDDPQRLSSFCVSCLDHQISPFTSPPRIVWSVENLALLRFNLVNCRSSEYFIYRAGRHGCRPSLDVIPDVGSYFARERINTYLPAVLPDGEGTDFILAAFGGESVPYKLHIFRSKRRAWTKELLVPDIPSWLTKHQRAITPNKVIALQGGLLGYVDLWKGILLCSVLNDPVTVKFIPLPKLLPNNRKHYNNSVARPIRDVTCTDGLIIRCVELEHLFNVTGSIPDASKKDVIFDSEAVDPVEEVKVVDFVGWRLITWYREVSWDYWRKGSVVHVDELGTVSLPHPDDFGGVAAELPLKDLKTSCPTMCGDDVVCLMSKMHYKDRGAWVVSVDMRSKTVRETLPFDSKRSLHTNPTYISCALGKYLTGESDGSQVGLQNARFGGHIKFQLPPQNSNNCSNAPVLKRQRQEQPNNSCF